MHHQRYRQQKVRAIEKIHGLDLKESVAFAISLN